MMFLVYIAAVYFAAGLSWAIFTFTDRLFVQDWPINDVLWETGIAFFLWPWSIRDYIKSPPV
jgi:hypothetical protein